MKIDYQCHNVPQSKKSFWKENAANLIDTAFMIGVCTIVGTLLSFVLWGFGA